jgi:hypothetical protein
MSSVSRAIRSCFSEGTASERPHVVQAIGELDEDHAHVPRHRQQHLAEVLGLRVLQRGELDAIDLRDAVDQVRHGLAEALGDLALGGRGVLDDVVQQRRHEGLRVEVPLREDLRDRERVGDVGLAALAVLAGVGRARDLVGLLDRVDVVAAQVPEDARQLLGSRAGQRAGRGLEPARDGMDSERRHRIKTGTDPVFLQHRRRRRRGIEKLAADLAGGDLAQRDHRGLVLVGLDQGRRAKSDLARAVGGGEGRARSGSGGT